MKFGQQLEESEFPEWKYYYLDYNGLKTALREFTPQAGSITDEDEAKFVDLMEKELDKVSSFRQLKADQLAKRIAACEAQVEAKLGQEAPPGEDLESWNAKRFAEVKVELDKISHEFNELNKFNRFNYTGFLKILKKHDKFSGRDLKSLFTIRLNHRPFFQWNTDPYIIKMSKLYDAIKVGGKRNEELSNMGGKQQDFVRKTIKYWVHPDNVTEVKFIILKHLPVLVFQKGDMEPDPAITSIYFDNDDFELYLGRLEKTEGAQAIRFRWYGRMDKTQEIFIERKTHHEDWTGESSVKQRVPIKEQHMNDYLAGNYDYSLTTAKLREKGTKSEKELASNEQIAREVQEAVLTRKLHPVVRSFYNRTAFQLPGDARVRISLDTELSMIREDNYDKPRSGNNWRRTDINTDYPFNQLPKEDIVRFPYAVLEVKLQTQFGTEPPQWIQDLVNSHLVEEVPKFSKFIHGVSTLLENHVSLLPFWLPQMDKDIRKPPPPPEEMPETLRLEPTSAIVQPTPPVPTTRRRTQDSLQPTAAAAAVATETTPFLVRQAAAKAAAQRREEELNSSFLDSCWPWARSRDGSSNVRVEPKAFFANERTFLSWLSFAITLGGLSLGLLNFGDKTAQIAGLVFTSVSILAMGYALWLFLTRAARLRRKESGPYDERVGPTFLVLILFAAVMVNFVMRLKHM